jgi:hypothetical protein
MLACILAGNNDDYEEEDDSDGESEGEHRGDERKDDDEEVDMADVSFVKPTTCQRFLI